MAISENKTILQIIVDKKVEKFIRRYCNMFSLSVSNFCNLALCEKIICLMNKEVN